MGLSACNSSGHLSNHADIAPNHAGITFAISNTLVSALFKSTTWYNGTFLLLQINCHWIEFLVHSVRLLVLRKTEPQIFHSKQPVSELRQLLLKGGPLLIACSGVAGNHTWNNVWSTHCRTGDAVTGSLVSCIYHSLWCQFCRRNHLH